MVIPGGTTYDDEYFSVKIDPNFLNIPVSNYTKVLVDNAIRINNHLIDILQPSWNKYYQSNQTSNNKLNKEMLIT